MDELDRILDGSLPRACGAEAVFRLRRVVVGSGACAALGPWLRQMGHQTLLVVADPRTWRAAGEAVRAGLDAIGVRWTVHELGGQPPCTDDPTIASAADAARAHAADALVAVGAGTVCDVTKAAATRLDRPWVSVPTAPSMNGYASAVAAVLRDGVKVTEPARQAEAIFADLDVLSQAPAEMIAAGLGDLVSKPLSATCWRIAAVMRGVRVVEPAVTLLDRAFDAVLARAAALPARDPEAIGRLVDALVLGGCAMALAGTSAPASGGEHLVSHYWDMLEHAAGRPVRALHGLQVAVGVGLVGRLHAELARAALQTESVEAWMQDHPPDAATLARRVRERHPDLPAPIVERVVAQALGKYRPPDAQRDALVALQRAWPRLRTALQRVAHDAERIEAALRAAGVPRTPAALGVDTRRVQHTVRVCRDIRSRYTVLDLAADTGRLEAFARRCTRDGVEDA